jgi:hypothetical protein
MKPQLYQVFRTYWQRPVLLLLGVGILLSLIGVYSFGLFRGSNEYVAPSRPIPSQYAHVQLSELEVYDAQAGTSQWTEILGRAKSIRTLDIRKDSDSELPDLFPFVNLEAISLVGEFSQSEIDQVAELKNLNTFSFLETPALELPQGTFTKLGKRIRHLESSDHGLLAHKNELKDLVNLHSLYLQKSSEDVNFDELLEVISLIPDLRTIVFNPQYLVRTREALAPLKKHPSLRNVYAQLSFIPDAEQKKINIDSPVRFLSLTYSSNRLFAIKIAQIVSVLISIILGIQLKSQFSSPYAQTVPNYIGLHRFTAISIFVSLTAVTVLGLILNGVPVLPALALVYWIPGCFALIVLATFNGQKWMAFVTAPLGIIIMTPLMFGAIILETFPSDGIWFLEGKLYTMTLTILAIEFISIRAIFIKLSTIHRTVNEKFAVMPSLEWKPNQANQLARNADRHPLFRFLDKSTTGLSHHNNSTWQLIQLWRKGNIFRPGIFLLFFVPVLFFATIVFGLILNGPSSGLSLQTIEMALFGGMTQFVGIGLVLPFMSWYQRTKYLEADSLRPADRKSFVKQLFLAYAVDHWIVWLAGIAALVYFLIFPNNGDLSVTLWLAPILPAAAIWLFGAGTSVFAYKNHWVAGIAGVIWAVLPVIGIIILAIIVEGYNLPETQQVQTISFAAIAMIPAGLLLVYRMHHRALNREWG